MKRILFALVFAFSLSAAGVSISTITCSSQVVTVNCTGCGIAQYQGFSIAGASVGTYNINSTAATASANTFTFAIPIACNGSASGGTVTPAKQIINIGMIPNVVAQPSKPSPWWVHGPVMAHLGAAGLDALSSWKQPEGNALFRQPTGPYAGRFYTNGAERMGGITIGICAVSELLGEIKPKWRKYVGLANGSAATVHLGVAASNVAQH